MQKIHATAWLFWGLCALYYAYENFLQVSLGVINDDLMQAFSIQAHEIGVLVSVYFAAYASMQIPVGILLDHFGTKKPLVIAASICAISTLLFANSQDLYIAFLARGLIGGASAFAALSCFNMAARHFPSHRFAMLTGLTLTTGMVGNMLAETPLEHWTAISNWRLVMSFMGFFGLFVVTLLHINLPTDTPKTASKLTWHRTLQELKTILKNPKSWLTSVYGMLMFTPFLLLLQGHGINYLESALHISRSDASMILTATLVGFAIGAPSLGWLSDHYRRRKPVLAFSAAALLASMLCLVFALPTSQLLCAVLFCCIGASVSGFLPAFSVLKEISPTSIQITVLGFMNTLNSLGTTIAAPILGYLLEKHWAHTLSKLGTPIYSPHAYHIAFSVLIAMALAACVIVFWIPETHAKHQSSR